MANGLSNGHVTDDVTDPEKSNSRSHRLGYAYGAISRKQNSCHLSTIANYYRLVYCEAIYGRLSYRQLGFIGAGTVQDV